jgi:hypothetical protein
MCFCVETFIKEGRKKTVQPSSLVLFVISSNLQWIRRPVPAEFRENCEKTTDILVCRFFWLFGVFSSSPQVVWWDDVVVVVSESAAGNGHRKRERAATSD